MRFFVLLILAFGSKKEETVAEDGTQCKMFGKINTEKPIIVKIEEDEYVKGHKKSTSKYVGVVYTTSISKWRAQRHSKNDNKKIYNGCYDTEEEAAHASDALARKLMKNGNRVLKLNFLDNDTEVHKRTSSEYIGVSFNKKNFNWNVYRHSKHDNKKINNGSYDSEEAAAYASDTLARELIDKGEQGYKLNFPDDEIEVYKKQKSSLYVGVTYDKTMKAKAKWRALRHSKKENKIVYNGCHNTEEEAAHASDTLAKQLIKNGEQGHKLNFIDDNTEHGKKRKRYKDFQNFQDN